MKPKYPLATIKALVFIYKPSRKELTGLLKLRGWTNREYRNAITPESNSEHTDLINRLKRKTYTEMRDIAIQINFPIQDLEAWKLHGWTREEFIIEHQARESEYIKRIRDTILIATQKNRSKSEKDTS